jgi:hypothetical protein
MKRKDTEVIRFLIGRGEERTSINQLSRGLGMDYKNAYGIVKRLSREGLILLERFGNTINCTVNKKPHPLIFRAEYERRDDLLKNRDLRVLHERLDSLPFSFIALVFGSWARGRARKGSDIDLMAVCEKAREKEVEGVVSLLPLDIHLVTLGYDEFLGMKKSREFSVVSEAMKGNVILIGIEDYYRLIRDAG